MWQAVAYRRVVSFATQLPVMFPLNVSFSYLLKLSTCIKTIRFCVATRYVCTMKKRNKSFTSLHT